MAVIYDILDVILPFSWLDYNFMKNAFLAVLLITPLFGILSTMVVSNRMAFFSDSLGHGAFTGLAIGSLVGIFSPLVSLVGFSILFALFLIVTYNDILRIGGRSMNGLMIRKIARNIAIFFFL